MFFDTELEKFADVKIWALKNARSYLGNGHMEKGDVVRILCDRAAMPLVEKVYKRCLLEGWNTYIDVRKHPQLEKIFFENANEDQLMWLPPWVVSHRPVFAENPIPYKNTIGETVKGYIGIFAPEDLHHLEDIDADKIVMNALHTIKPFRDAIEPREARGEFGWALTVVPTQALADEAGMSLEDYTGEVARACFLDLDDPVAEWEKLYQYTKKVGAWLKNLDIDYLTLLSENCDLKVRIGEGRKWISVSGHNIPSYETFTTPDFRFTHGRYYADKVSLKDGNIVKGVRLLFSEGQVVKATAEEGEEFLHKMLDTDEGAVRVGEFSLTDKRFSKITKFMAHTLYDENVGGENGNCHIALGLGFPGMVHDGGELSQDEQKELGYNNSALHWDLVNGEKKTVVAKLKNGEKITIYDDGQFTMED